MVTFSVCLHCQAVNRVSLQEAAKKEPVCGKCKKSLPIHFGINEVSDASLQKLLEKSTLPLVVDFWAPWCAPCKAFAPTFQQAALQNAGHFVFCKLDTENYPRANEIYRIKSIPTLIKFVGGREEKRVSGAMNIESLISWIN